MNTQTTIRKQYPGCYRITLTDETFAQVKRQGREWLAEVRHTQTGVLLRYAGLWSTRQKAVTEVTSTTYTR